MFHVEKISSLDLPELAPYRTLRRPAEHREQGIFVAEGDKLVHRLLESGFQIVSVLLADNRFAEFEPLLKQRSENAVVYVAPKSVLSELVGFELYQGVLAVAKTPPAPSLDEILKAASQPRLFVAVDGLANSENLGVIVRSCAGFGVHALFVGETSSSPFLRRAVRNSMGGIFQIPIVECASLVRTLQELKSHKIRIIAAHPHSDQKALWQAGFTNDGCIVFGSEGHGISEPVLAVCDEAVRIPMALETDSLNVSNAAAIFLYEATRQRAMKTDEGVLE